MTGPVQIEQVHEVWWLKPQNALGMTAGIASVLAMAVPTEVYEQSWRTPKYVTYRILLYVSLAIAMFVAGAVLGAKRRISTLEVNPSWEENIPWGTMLLMFRISVVLCAIGYLTWALSAVSRGLTLSLVLGALTGEKGVTYELRSNYLNTIKGVTTMTQFGVPAIIFGALLGLVRGWRKVWLPMAAIFILAVLRALLNSERLAAIELAVPTLVLFVLLKFLRRGAPSKVLRYAPLIAVGVIFVVFTAGEYSRSWITFYQGGDQNLMQFGGQRLLGYYVTALNNSAFLWRELNLPLGAPYFTFAFLWKFPIIGEFTQNLSSGMGLLSYEQYMDLLANGANPEFNNTGGILLPLMDFGISGGLLYWLVCGWIAGVLYTSLLRRTPAGLLLYPLMFTGLIESPRILYWSDGRFFPALAMLAVSVILFSTERRRELHIRWIRADPARETPTSA